MNTTYAVKSGRGIPMSSAATFSRRCPWKKLLRVGDHFLVPKGDLPGSGLRGLSALACQAGHVFGMTFSTREVSRGVLVFRVE